MLPDITLLQHQADAKPSEPKVDRLASYNAHKIAVMSTMAEFCCWNADSYPGTELEKAVQVWRQVSTLVGHLEQA